MSFGGGGKTFGGGGGGLGALTGIGGRMVRTACVAFTTAISLHFAAETLEVALLAF